jgi:hypothetical protein
LEKMHGDGSTCDKGRVPNLAPNAAIRGGEQASGDDKTKGNEEMLEEGGSSTKDGRAGRVEMTAHLGPPLVE